MSKYTEDEEFYSYKGGLVFQTDLAYRVAFDDGYEFWVPKSELEDLYVSEDEFLISFSLPEWLHREKESVYEKHKLEIEASNVKKKQTQKALDAINEM